MENIWILFALVSAFTLATSDAFTKKALLIHNEYLIAWLRLLLSLPILFVSLLFIPIPPLDKDFFTAFFIALPLEVAATILYIKALRISPLSLTLPFLSLTPVFLIVVPYVLLGERISIFGGIGVFLIAAGGYTLNIKEFKKGIFEPFMAIKREKGSVYMIIVALIFSFTSSLGKMAIEHSSPVFFGAAYIAVLVFFLTPIALYKGRDELRPVLKNGAIKSAVIPGILQSAMIISHMIAMSLANVAYMISVKRLSLLIGVFYGYLFFKESGIKERMLGTVLMLAGFMLIVLYH
ncbi:MAG: DMT family transporter [Thermodesulfovibrionales bacterium]|nr:DMT family transporter [Thermodesulfovibrionales bacterium]